MGWKPATWPKIQEQGMAGGLHDIATLILRSRKERKDRCTIWPLRNHPAVRIVNYPCRELPCPENAILLHPEGAPLSAADSGRPIILLDGSWRHAASMATHYARVERRSLPGVSTAYPRRSKLGTDPDGGLASVEALYVAHMLIGKTTAGLLAHYGQGREFLEMLERDDPEALKPKPA
jgi:pre-rRNA-processing protein TSR3